MVLLAGLTTRLLYGVWVSFARHHGETLAQLPSANELTLALLKMSLLVSRQRYPPRPARETTILIRPTVVVPSLRCLSFLCECLGSPSFLLVLLTLSP